MFRNGFKVLRKRWYLLATLICCCQTVMIVGIQASWTSPVFPKINNITNLEQNPLHRPITSEEQSWIGSCLSLGAIFGPLIGGITINKIGHKKTLIFFCGLPSAISFLILAFAETTLLYYASRFLGGISVGIVAATIPPYLSEISEPSIRGSVSSSLNIFTVFGQLISLSIGPYLSIMNFSVICFIFPILFIITFAGFPDSPYYYVSQNNLAAAKNALYKLRNETSDENINKELTLIKSSLENNKNDNIFVRDTFKNKGFRRAFIISLGLLGLQQLSGINVVLFYITDIFQAGNTLLDSNLSSIIVGSIQFLASFFTPLVTDTLGRKPLLLTSAVGMLISQTSLGFYFFLKENGANVDSITWLPIVCMIGYIITYNLGFGPLPWTMMGEIFSSNLRTGASAVSACFCWLMAFLVGKFFINLIVAYGVGITYWIFSIFCFIAILFSYFVIIETKGKTFDEIQEELSR